MLLRRLEAYGFKSFADKTEIEFGTGITVVVGPNGSGKSNISDAIRWVLGEQSIRTLRGAKMEDIIFAGSANRKPLGIAEVSLTFDNSDGTLPIDFNEVIITRRVYRSGDSEYFINKSLCRLKDIYELLADTGLGRDAMTVIGQNKVDEVLNSKPEERRLLFEESAGISKYKQRKKDALRKLDDTTQNLIRVSDITNEIESQLTPLAESAERTAQYNKLQSELTAYQVTLLINMLEKSEKMVESAALQKTHLTEQEITVTTNVNIKETDKIQLTEQLAKVDDELTAYANAISTADTELEKINGKIAVLQERITHGQRSQDRTADEQVRIIAQKDELEQRISTINETLLASQTTAEELNTVLAQKNVLYQNILTDLEQTQQQLETNQEKTFDYLHEIVGQRNEAATIERDLEKLQVQQQTFQREQQEYNTQVSDLEVGYQDILTEQQTINQTLDQLDGEKNSALSTKQIQEQKLAQISHQEKQLTTQIHELNSRFNILSNMQNEYEGFARGIKSVLKSDASWQRSICGAVAQIITVPDKYVTAVEIALGGALQHIITENANTAKEAMEFLKTKNMGRATFLPLDTIRPLKPRDNELVAAKSSGSLGFAANLVTCEPRYRIVIESLLGRVIIAENIDIALKIAKQQQFSVKIVTLDGEVLNPGGSMTGGSINKRESSFLSRGNAIATIQTTVAELNITLKSVEQQVVVARNELLHIEEQLALLQEKRQRTEVRQAEVAIHAEKIQVDINRLHGVLKAINEGTANAVQEQQQLTLALERTKTTITELESRDTEHQQSLTVWQQKIKELQDAKEELQSHITDVKIKLTTAQQEITSIMTSIQQNQQAKQSIAEQLERLIAESNDLLAQISQTNQELQENAEQHSQLALQKETDKQRHKDQYVIKLNILAMLQQVEKEVKELRRTQNDLQARLHEVDLLETKYTYEVTHSYEKLAEQFCLTRSEAKDLCRDETIDNMTKFVRNLEKEILALGPVNHGAVTEYTSLKTRYEFLQKQAQDLMDAKDYLASIITDIDKTMSAKFIASFTKINEFFGEIFVRLFGGGSAELKLVDPDNMLSTGIEIIVQAPGKKMQNMALLSGGERTLTVIALLFAFLTYRPAPLIVVDEIDASLDEANVDRLSEFLLDYAKNTQFIVVTHRKGTMEAATVIYGVTMEQSGVSRLVSVKLMEKTG